jgi:hypothetical protein
VLTTNDLKRTLGRRRNHALSVPLRAAGAAAVICAAVRPHRPGRCLRRQVQQLRVHAVLIGGM